MDPDDLLSLNTAAARRRAILPPVQLDPPSPAGLADALDAYGPFATLDASQSPSPEIDPSQPGVDWVSLAGALGLSPAPAPLPGLDAAGPSGGAAQAAAGAWNLPWPAQPSSQDPLAGPGADLSGSTSAVQDPVDQPPSSTSGGGPIDGDAAGRSTLAAAAASPFADAIAPMQARYNAGDQATFAFSPSGGPSDPSAADRRPLPTHEQASGEQTGWRTAVAARQPQRQHPSVPSARAGLQHPGASTANLAAPQAAPTRPGPGPAAGGLDPARLAHIQALLAEYDQLGPVEFSKRATQFGLQIEAAAAHHKLWDKQSAADTYNVLQYVLSFWGGYPYKSPEAAGNILSASSQLYQSACNAGIASADELPQSYIDAAMAAMQYEGPNLSALRRPGLSLEEFLPPAGGGPARGGGIGGTVDNQFVRIVWGKGAMDQGDPWERYIQTLLPKDARIFGFKTWDFLHRPSSVAISAKTIDTSTRSYSRDPRNVYYTLTRYVDAAASFNRPYTRKGVTVAPSDIAPRVIYLAVPDTTTPPQWKMIARGIDYANSRNVRVHVTRIAGPSA